MSLLALKECIRAYSNDSKHIPFRSNKLTLYLRDFFITNSLISMISLISSENKHLIDTLDTLKYTDYMHRVSLKKLLQLKENNTKIKKTPIKNIVKNSIILK